MINTVVKNRVGWRGVNLNLDNVFKYTVCFFWMLPLNHIAMTKFNVITILTFEHNAFCVKIHGQKLTTHHHKLVLSHGWPLAAAPGLLQHLVQRFTRHHGLGSDSGSCVILCQYIQLSNVLLLSSISHFPFVCLILTLLLGFDLS